MLEADEYKSKSKQISFMEQILKINSIGQFHEILGYDKPLHPLITFIDFSKVEFKPEYANIKVLMGFYSVMFKKCCFSNFKYGRKEYDFSEATLLCIGPEQAISIETQEEENYADGWGLFFHPDLFRRSFLNQKIDEYSFFAYDRNEALHLSDQENKTLQAVLQMIKKEMTCNMDTYSNDLIISNIEVLLNYCKRFYGRQFITRGHENSEIAEKFQKLIQNYFKSEQLKLQGLPTVKYCAGQLFLSPNYLSDLLKQETGKTAKEHIHYHLIEKAKNLLLNTHESVSEIAYDLGFEHPQNFSKLFKKKTGMSPKAYAKGIN